MNCQLECTSTESAEIIHSIGITYYQIDRVKRKREKQRRRKREREKDGD